MNLEKNPVIIKDNNKDIEILTSEVIMSITKTNNKNYKLGIYDKAINNLIHD